MFDVMQKTNESIRELVERFNQAAVNASELTDDIKIMAFVKALLPNSRLAFEFSRKNPTSGKEMCVVAHENMVAQKLLSQRRIDVTRGPEPKPEQRREYSRMRNPEPWATSQKDHRKTT